MRIFKETIPYIPKGTETLTLMEIKAADVASCGFCEKVSSYIQRTFESSSLGYHIIDALPGETAGHYYVRIITPAPIAHKIIASDYCGHSVSICSRPISDHLSESAKQFRVDVKKNDLGQSYRISDAETGLKVYCKDFWFMEKQWLARVLGPRILSALIEMK